MYRFLAQRLAALVATLVAVSMIIFMMVRLLPGSILDLFFAGDNTASPEQSPLLEELLRVLEETLPFDAVYADMASERRPQIDVSDGDRDDALLALAENILASLGPDTAEGQRFLAALSKTEPFSRVPHVAQIITDRFKS